jgi:pimeloyl-ACP methyl ester carboxylesterase
VLVDLVQTTTRDGVRLDGAFLAAPSAPAVPADTFCLVHGTGGNFYSSSLFDSLTERLFGLGCGVLRVNTRGHDGISNALTQRGGRRQGAAYEAFDDCRHDIRAWVDWLVQRGVRRVSLLGHSSGAIKAIYTLAHDPQPAVTCLVALSPPRLSYSRFCSSPQGPDFLATYRRAEKLVGAGQPAALLDVQLPLPMVITAAGYAEKYGPQERYDFVPLLRGVACPILVTLGELEVEKNMAFAGLPEALAPLTERNRRLSVVTVAGADHFYTGVCDDLLGRIEGWLRGLPSA